MNKYGTVLFILKPVRGIGKLFFQNAPYKSPEFRDFIGHNVPDDIIINSKVVVDEFVPCPSNSSPVDCAVLTPEFIGQSLYCLANNFYTPNECPFQGLISHESLL